MSFSLNKNRFQENLILLFIILCFFSGIFSFASFLLDNSILKLWKEIYILFLSFILVVFNIKKLRINVKFLAFFFFCCFFMLEIVYSILLDVPIMVILYQLKNDFLLFVITSSIYLYFNNVSDKKIVSFSKILLKTIFFLGFLNAISMILESIFFKVFLSVIGLDFGNWGVDAGVKIVTVGNDIFRAIGFQNGFVQSGTLILLVYIIFVENNVYIIKKKWKYFLFSIIYITSICVSTYVTAILGLLYYILFKFIKLLSNTLHLGYSLGEKINYFVIVISFILLFILTHWSEGYYFLEQFFSDKAYTSIWIRILQHWEIILDSSDSIVKLLLGIGLGVNGVFGLDKSIYGIYSIATDSTYIYLLSNYGLIGVILFIEVLIYLFACIRKNNILGVKYFIIYLLVIEFFFNNIIVNFPNNVIFLLLVILEFRLEKIRLFN